MQVLCHGLEVASAQLPVWDLALKSITSLEPDQHFIYTKGAY